jgi:hypothetical protein
MKIKDNKIDNYPYIFDKNKDQDLIKNRWLLFTVIVLLIFIIICALCYIIIPSPKSIVSPVGADKFGVKEFYSTKNGREWFINIGNPKQDCLFSITGNIPIVKQNGNNS